MSKSQFLSIPRQGAVYQKLQWIATDNPMNYEKVKHKVPYGPNDITYEFNNYGFRCDDFESWNKHPYRILFAGCSFTEGTGLPLEHTWAKVLHKMICEELKVDIPFWSIAVGGTGLDQMVRYLYHFGDILRPQIIIGFLPPIYRRERWAEDKWLPDNPNKETVKVLGQEEFAIYQTEKNMVMLNLLLEKWNSHMLYSSWSFDFNYEYMETLRTTYERKIFMQDHDKARDYGHFGPKSNEIFAQELFKKYHRLILDNLKIDVSKNDV